MKYYDLDRPTIIEEILEKQERNKPKTKDVLEKIRNEIAENYDFYYPYEDNIAKGLSYALDIVDDCIKEITNETNN